MKGADIPETSIKLLDQMTRFFKQATYYLLIWNNRVVDISPKLLDLLDYPSFAQFPDFFAELIPKEHPKEFLVYHLLFANQEHRENYDLKLEGRHGRVVTIRFSAQQICVDEHQSVGMLIGEDVTYQQKKLEDLSADSSLFTFNPYSIAITDPHGVILKVNPKFLNKTHFEADEVQGQNIFNIKTLPECSKEELLKDILNHNDYRAEFLSYTREGFQYDEDVYVIPVYKYGELTSLLFIGEDISTKKRLLMNLEQKAYYDDLTGYYRKDIGRSLLHEVCESGDPFGLFFIDYRDFKGINDRCGHHVGDEVLKLGAQLIKNALRTQDILIRWGGDEFIIIVPTLHDTSAMGVVANKIREAFVEMEIDDQVYQADIDIGGCYCSSGASASYALEVLKVADANMYMAKQGGLPFYITEFGGGGQSQSSHLEMSIVK